MLRAHCVFLIQPTYGSGARKKPWAGRVYVHVLRTLGRRRPTASGPLVRKRCQLSFFLVFKYTEFALRQRKRDHEFALRRPWEGPPLFLCNLRRVVSFDFCACKQSHVGNSWFVMGVEGKKRSTLYRELCRRLSRGSLSTNSQSV